MACVVGGEDVLADAEDDGDVAAGLHLMILAADLRLLAGQHLRRVLRIDEGLEAFLADRIEGDDLDAALGGILQRMQKARTVRAGVLAEEEHRVAVAEIVEDDGADARADDLLQRDRRRLVAHVGAVGQIVVAVEAREQRVEVGGLEAGAAGGIEDDGFRIERLQLRADRGEGFVPLAGHVAVGRAVVAHRMGQAALLLEIVVVPVAQLGDGMLGEEVRRAAPRGQLPQRRLGAVLAELEGVIVGRLGPGAGDAHEALRLVLATQRVKAAGESHSLPKMRAMPSSDPQPPAGPSYSTVFSGGSSPASRARVMILLLFGNRPACASATYVGDAGSSVRVV